jgi:hypothetical protein
LSTAIRATSREQYRNRPRAFPSRNDSGSEAIPDASGDNLMMKTTHKWYSLIIALVITVCVILGGLYLGAAHVGFYAPPQSPGAEA